MKYFWALDSASEGTLVADVVDFKGVDVDSLCIGRRIDHWNPESCVSVGSGGRSGPPDDVLQTAAAVPIFSDTLRRTLDRAGIDGIQYLAVRVFDGSAELEGYAIANVLNRLAALDERASDLRRFSDDYFIESRRGKISGLRRPVLRCVPELETVDVFRLAEFWPPIFVSSRFRDVFRFGQFTGFDFSEVLVTGDTAPAHS